MPERRVRAAEDVLDNLPEIDYVGRVQLTSKPTEEFDPFAKKATEIKALSGTTPAFKRKVANQLKKFRQGEDGTPSKAIEWNSLIGYDAFDVVVPDYNQYYLAKLYEVASAHKAAVDAKVANIVGLGYNFVETPKTKRALEQIQQGAGSNAKKLQNARRKLDQHKEDLLNMLDEFNQEDTFAEVLQKVWKDYETTGNGYIEVGRKKDGTIGYVGHIMAPTIRIRRKRDGFVQIISNKAVYFRNFGDRETVNPFGNDAHPNEIIHIKKYSPTHNYYGVPDIVAAQSAIAGNEFSARFNLDYFENKAVPRHVIVLKGAKLGTAAEQALLQFFETGLKGQNHRTLYIPLPGDSPEEKVSLEIKPVEAGTQDSSFNNYRKGNLNEILMAHRVPITKVSVGEGVSLAVARDADKTFKEQVCAPEQRIFEKKLNRIIKELTDAFSLALNEMTLTDANTQSQIDERHIKNQTKTPNEVRASLGLTGLPGGDKVVQPKPTAAPKGGAANPDPSQGNRERDSQRSANRTDSAGEGRNPKGEGRTTQ